jgi:hypothetical protein
MLYERSFFLTLKKYEVFSQSHLVLVLCLVVLKLLAYLTPVFKIYALQQKGKEFSTNKNLYFTTGEHQELRVKL